MPENLPFPLPVLPELYSERQAANLVRLDRAGQEILEGFHRQFFAHPLQEFHSFLEQFESQVCAFFDEGVALDQRIPTARRLLNQLLQTIERLRHEQLQNWQKQESMALHQLHDSLHALADNLQTECPLSLPSHQLNRQHLPLPMRLRLLLSAQIKGSWHLNVPERGLALHYVYYANFRFLNELFVAYTQEFLQIWQQFFHMMEDLAKFLRIYYNTEAAELKLQRKHLCQELAELRKRIELLQQKQEERLLIHYRLSLRKMASWQENPLAQKHVNRLQRHALAFTQQVRQVQKFPKLLQKHRQPAANNLYLALLLMRLQNRLLQERDQLLSLTDKEAADWQALARQLNEPTAQPEELKDKIPQESALLRQVQDDSQNLLDRIRDFPEKLTIYPVAGDSNEEAWHAGQSQEIPVVRSMAFQLETHFLAPLLEHSHRYHNGILRQRQRLQESLSLAAFLEENPQAETGSFTQPELRPAQNPQFSELLTPTKNRKKAFQQDVQEIVSLANDALQPIRMLQQAQQLREEWQQLQGGRLRTQMQDYASQSGKFTRKLLARLFYSGSQGFLLARRLLHEPPEGVNLAALLQLRDALQPSPTVLSQLPVHYQNLFSGQAIIGADFWVDRLAELQAFKQAISWHNSGQGGAIAITGEPGIGVSTFMRYAASQYFPHQAVFQLRPPLTGSCSPEAFEHAFQQATGLSGKLADLLSNLPVGSVLLLHDLELWWDRRPGGLEVIELLLELIRRYAGRILFILGINRFSLNSLSRVSPISEHCILMLDLPPLDARSLQALILLRHRAGGLKFQLNKTSEEQLSEIRFARLFSKYFNQNQGNPTASLQSWMRSIRKFSSNDKLLMSEPVQPDLEALSELPDTWLRMLAVFILHKHLNAERLQQVEQLSAQEAKLWLGHLQRAGLLSSLQDNLFQLTPELRPGLLQILKDRNFLVV